MGENAETLECLSLYYCSCNWGFKLLTEVDPRVEIVLYGFPDFCSAAALRENVHGDCGAPCATFLGPVPVFLTHTSHSSFLLDGTEKFLLIFKAVFQLILCQSQSLLQN